MIEEETFTVPDVDAPEFDELVNLTGGPPGLFGLINAGGGLYY
jgi:hypothetical protein